MCLDTITAKNRNLSGTGWKVFTCIYNGYSTPCYGWGIHASGKWIENFKSKIYYNKIGALNYPSGFHIFKKKSDAEWFLIWLYRGTTGVNLLIKKVLYRQAHTYGTQFIASHAKVIVANEMKILN